MTLSTGARDPLLLALTACLALVLLLLPRPAAAAAFNGQFYRGEGDVEYLQLLDVSRRLFAPDPEFQNIAMLYTPAWDGFVEGPTWGAWWIQNSYGPTYCALPFFEEPYVTFLQNAQDLWFQQMGDGKRVFKWKDNEWLVPDGQLCDAAAPDWVVPKQGDGRVDIHDWGMEFTAAGVVMQAELLLIGRDAKAIEHYLPLLERCANFIETRRDPKNNLFLAGAAGNLLAPSYAGWKKPDGTYDKAYLAGLSITYIAGLDRLIELERLAGRSDKANWYTERRDLARKGLPLLTTDEGYFLKYLDPDGTKHGVYGAKEHGYFEAVCNHDALCFRVADDAQAERIYAKLASIPGLRRHDLIITNEPSLDDMYEPDTGWLWKHGTWVNGGHWTTCEARMVMAYYRLGKYEDARRSMKKLLTFARDFRLDNPLVDFGNAVYQPKEPINLCYDSFGGPAAMVRGLFEYLYRADGLTLLPHVPPGVTRLEQNFPLRFGAKRLYLATVGSGAITGVLLNGKRWKSFDAKSVFLPYDRTPAEAAVQILLGGAKPGPFTPAKATPALPPPPGAEALPADLFPVIVPNQLPLRLGADSNGENRFLGDLAQPVVFSRALTADEVGALVESGLGGLSKDPALVGAWTLGDQQAELFPNPVDADLSAKAVGHVEVVDGPKGKAVRLSGEGYLEIANAPKVSLTHACTMAAWICPKVLPPGGARIIDKTQVGTSNGYLLDTCPSNSLRLIVERGSLGHAANLVPDQWAHVAATVAADGTEALYLNGKAVATQQRTTSQEVESLAARVAKLRAFHQRLEEAGLGDSYEAAHARLAVQCLSTAHARLKLLAEGKLTRLPEASQYAADKSYFSTAAKLCDGLERLLKSYEDSADARKQRVWELWEG
ncbi:MAG: hypothetical protein COZ06_37840 [Armatimonadetes bacterium CG_4_10_14_3_um_filter_66_18]|nr:MAG: hypothetical protein COZ06_37840 [Armatimonadetes bacterium CG_4_10_14_3_um_filter_66_18]